MTGTCQAWGGEEAWMEHEVQNAQELWGLTIQWSQQAQSKEPLEYRPRGLPMAGNPPECGLLTGDLGATARVSPTD